MVLVLLGSSRTIIRNPSGFKKEYEEQRRAPCFINYLRDADVLIDVFCQEDHVPLLGHHHDEAGQRLREESVHRVFVLLLFHTFFCWNKKKP